ncbi:hypothetical protein HYV84_06950 [Candidatus Woesearchaeota archaeon]|nr:hypothetical protein [Candidatus Woesearchaeota archaeon]
MPEEAIELVNPELRKTLFEILRRHGEVNPAYRQEALTFVQKRMGDLERHIADTFFNGQQDIWSKAPEVRVTAPNWTAFNSKEYEAARNAVSSGGLKFSAGIWYLTGRLGSRFSPVIVPDGERLSIEDVINFCHRVGVTGIAWHTRGEMGPGNRDAILENLKTRNMHVSSEFANLFTETTMKFGGITSGYAAVRELSYLRKLEGMLWCGQDGADFQVDWLGQDGPLVYQPNAPRRRLLIEYMADALMLTEMPIAIEYKTGDPAVKMTEKDVTAALDMAKEAESLVYSRIKQQVLEGMGGKLNAANALAWTTESVRLFSRLAGKIGLNIEDGHDYTESARTTSHAVEEGINSPLTPDFLSDVHFLKTANIEVIEANEVIKHFKGRLFHRHPNDSFIGQGDPDFIPASVHETDFVVAAYHEQKAGLHKEISYEPDLYAVRGDPLKDFVEAINRVNRGHAIAANLIAIEKKEGLSCILDQPQEKFSRYYVMAVQEMPLNYQRIDLDIVDKFREEVGKPIKFPYVPLQGHGKSLPIAKARASPN